MTKRAIVAVLGLAAVPLVLGFVTQDTPPTEVATVKSVQPTPELMRVAPVLIEERTIEYRMDELPDEFIRANSPDAGDLKGYEKSLYKGKYYNKSQEGFRKCVMRRESNFRYKAANKTSSARGAYQFLDSKWREGLVHMMKKESKETDDLLRTEADLLFDKKIHKWDRYWQDRAFFTALNWNGDWTGKKHWNATVKGTGC